MCCLFVLKRDVKLQPAACVVDHRGRACIVASVCTELCLMKALFVLCATTRLALIQLNSRYLSLGGALLATCRVVDADCTKTGTVFSVTCTVTHIVRA